MFLEVDETSIRIFDNPSDERNKWKLSQLQFFCEDMLLCTMDAFKNSTVKAIVKKTLEELQPKIDSAIASNCKVLYFLDALESKRKIFVVCPLAKSNIDILETRFTEIMDKY